MIQIFSPRRSDGARELAAAIRAAGAESRVVRRLAGRNPGDVTVSWGFPYHSDAFDDMPILNGAQVGGKLTQFQTMRAAGVSVPDHRRHEPPEAGGWLGRASSHKGGADLIRPPRRPDFWVRYVPLSAEFRIHVFQKPDGEFIVIRAGRKVPGPEGIKRPEWVRSWDLGWRLAYNGPRKGELPKGLREEAKKAVQALGLHFGAVDIGITEEGARPLVLEVNRAPGLEGGTPQAYARKIMEWGGRG